MYKKFFTGKAVIIVFPTIGTLILIPFTIPSLIIPALPYVFGPSPKISVSLFATNIAAILISSGFQLVGNLVPPPGEPGA